MNRVKGDLNSSDGLRAQVQNVQQCSSVTAECVSEPRFTNMFDISFQKVMICHCFVSAAS